MNHRLLISIFLTIVSITARAQIPYFSTTIGDKKLYGYTSLKFRPGMNTQESYTTLQYGIGEFTATGLDLYTSNAGTLVGCLFRAGYKFNPRFGIGGQLTPSFDIHDKFNFSYLTSALYMNGAISEDGKLFWCSNTWWVVNKGAENTFANWEYLGYAFSLKKGHYITPMAGIIHSWKFDQEIDISVGVDYSFKRWNFYLWGNDFLTDNPRLVVGVDFFLRNRIRTKRNITNKL